VRDQYLIVSSFSPVYSHLFLVLILSRMIVKKSLLHFCSNLLQALMSLVLIIILLAMLLVVQPSSCIHVLSINIMAKLVLERPCLFQFTLVILGTGTSN
jgi:hypothetical protein